MSSTTLSVLVAAPVADDLLAALAATPYGAYACERTDAAGLAARIERQPVDALLLDGAADALAAHVDALAADIPTLVLVPAGPAPTADAMAGWYARGVQEVLLPADLADGVLARRLHAAIERHRHEREMRKAYATDLETGLPHQQQLIEHMSHLIALRERQPAPMALLVLRIEGFATTQARHGAEAAHVLRRKVGVRLRAGVRASDVVASLGDDSFGVLLASMLAPADAERVGAKLLAALAAPVKITGQDVAVAAAIGIAQHPADGTQPEALLRRAVGLAASAQAIGRAGYANYAESGGTAGGAANDD